MKLKEYIQALQTVVEENPGSGELEVIYSKDEEGNGYHKVYDSDAGTLALVLDIDDYLIEDVITFPQEALDRGFPFEPNAVIIN